MTLVCQSWWKNVRDIGEEPIKCVILLHQKKVVKFSIAIAFWNRITASSSIFSKSGSATRPGAEKQVSRYVKVVQWYNVRNRKRLKTMVFGVYTPHKILISINANITLHLKLTIVVYVTLWIKCDCWRLDAHLSFHHRYDGLSCFHLPNKRKSSWYHNTIKIHLHL